MFSEMLSKEEIQTIPPSAQPTLQPTHAPSVQPVVESGNHVFVEGSDSLAKELKTQVDIYPFHFL